MGTEPAAASVSAGRARPAAASSPSAAASPSGSGSMDVPQFLHVPVDGLNSTWRALAPAAPMCLAPHAESRCACCLPDRAEGERGSAYGGGSATQERGQQREGSGGVPQDEGSARGVPQRSGSLYEGVRGLSSTTVGGGSPAAAHHCPLLCAQLERQVGAIKQKEEAAKAVAVQKHKAGDKEGAASAMRLYKAYQQQVRVCLHRHRHICTNHCSARLTHTLRYWPPSRLRQCWRVTQGSTPPRRRNWHRES